MSATPSTLSDKVYDLVFWQDPTQTFVLISSGILFFFLVNFTHYTVITMVSYIVLIHLCICFIYTNGTKIYLKIAGYQTPSSKIPASARLKLSPEWVQYQLTDLVEKFNWALAFLISTAACDNNKQSAGAIILFSLLSIIGRFLDGITVTFIIFMAILTIPKLWLLFSRRWRTKGPLSLYSYPHTLRSNSTSIDPNTDSVISIL